MTLQVRLRNDGPRSGREVIQVYASRPDSAVARPPQWLVGFTTISAAAGDEVTATVVVPTRAFQHWDETTGAWHIEPGPFHLHVGPSSANQPLLTAIDLPPP